METKPALKSKTLWFTAITGLAGVVALFFPQANVVTQWMNANGMLLASIWSGLAFALRLATKGKIVLSE